MGERSVRLVARFIDWAEKPCWTRGEAVLFCAAWLIAGTISLVLGWNKIWEVAPLVVGVTCIAAFGQGFVRGFVSAMYRDLHNGSRP